MYKVSREFFRNGKISGDFWLSGHICAGGSFGILETLGTKQTSLLGPKRPRSSKITGIVQALDFVKGLF